MCNRQKPISSTEVAEIKVIMKNRKARLEYLESQGFAESKEAKEHRSWITDNEKVLKRYYRPAMII